MPLRPCTATTNSDGMVPCCRWHMTSEQEGSWWKDVQDSMSRWSVHRARVEEEISRRQEASRYGAPHTNKYSTTFNILVKVCGGPSVRSSSGLSMVPATSRHARNVNV